jgi:hypothetical protein
MMLYGFNICLYNYSHCNFYVWLLAIDVIMRSERSERYKIHGDTRGLTIRSTTGASEASYIRTCRPH